MYRFLITIFCLVIFLRQYLKSQVLSSTSIFCLCYFLIFVIYPASVNTSFNNANLIDKCALAGIICYAVGLFFGSNIKVNSIKNNKNINFPPFLLSSFLFFVCFFVSMFFVFRFYGMDAIRKLIAGGVTVRELSLSINSVNLFSFSQHTMIPCILCMWMSAKNKKHRIVSIIAIVLYVLESIFLSFTRIFLISIILIIFFYELRKASRKKQVLFSLIGVVSVILLMVIMNYIRCLGLSYELDLKTILNIDVIFESTDFAASYNMLDKLLDFNKNSCNSLKIGYLFDDNKYIIMVWEFPRELR